MTFYFEDLKNLVIDRGFCTQCGTCAAVCSIVQIDNGVPYVEDLDDCTGCGQCFTTCPQINIGYENIGSIFQKADQTEIGPIMKIRSVKLKQRPKFAQDGGVVTKLVEDLLSKGVIEAAVLTKRDSFWHPITEIVTENDVVERFAGSKYTTSTPIPKLIEATKNYDKVLFVGLPCHLRAVRKLQMHDGEIVNSKNIHGVVGLFCMESFLYSRVFGNNLGVLGLPSEIQSMQIKQGKLEYRNNDGSTSEMDLEDLSLNLAINNYCKICQDFTASLADVSVGSVGSKPHYSTVIVRNSTGERLFNVIEDIIEEPANIKQIKTLSDKKKTSREPLLSMLDYYAMFPSMQLSQVDTRIKRPSGMCEVCSGCGECIIGYYADTGSADYCENIDPRMKFGRATFGAVKRLPSVDDFQIKPRWRGGYKKKLELGREPVYSDASLFEVLGGIRCKIPVIIAAVGSTKVADRISAELSEGAARGGIIRTIGENVLNMHGKQRLIEEIDEFGQHWDGEHGGLICQANAEDWIAGVPAVVIDHVREQYGSKFVNDALGFELKGGQGAKPGMGGEVRIFDREKARMLKRKGYILFPDPDVSPAGPEGYERHSAPGIIALHMDELREKFENLYDLGYKRLFFKTGAYDYTDLAATFRICSEMKVACVTIDGSEGGTGMSPRLVMNEVGLSTLQCLVGGYKILRDLCRERQYKSSFVIAGGLARADHLVKAVILGADGIAMASSFCGVARYKGAEGVVNYIRSLDIEGRQLLSTTRKYTLAEVRGFAKSYLSPVTLEASQISGLPIHPVSYQPEYE
jgi:coenzyme F420-reducing hydrogenase beta subunit